MNNLIGLIDLAAKEKLTATVKLPVEYFTKAGYHVGPPPPNEQRESVEMKVFNTGKAKLLEVSENRVKVEIAGDEYLISPDDVQTIDLKTTGARCRGGFFILLAPISVYQHTYLIP